MGVLEFVGISPYVNLANGVVLRSFSPRGTQMRKVSRRAERGPPVVVLGAGVNGLGVARSLGSAGVPVLLADTDVGRPEMRTRYARPLRLSSLHGRGLVDDLVSMARDRIAGKPPVLILTQEQSVRTLLRHREEVGQFYRFLLPPTNMVEALMHKDRFALLARKFDLRVPVTVRVREISDIDYAMALTYPVVVKPSYHAPEYDQYFRKAYLVEDVSKIRDLLERMLPTFSDLIVQEWIPGTDADVFFCLMQLGADGRAEAHFVGKKIRSWPPTVGGTASCIAAPDKIDLYHLTEQFFVCTSMCGLASMEFKQHAVTKEFFAIEPTVGRTDHQEEIATLNGVNLPYAYYCSVIEKPYLIPESRKLQVPSRIWSHRISDVQSRNHSEQLVQGWPTGSHRVFDATLRASDPYPWVATQLNRLRTKVLRILRKPVCEERGHGI